jgi:HK97 family phage major capsid protein
MDEPTLQEVSEAFEALKKAVATGTLTEEKSVKIDIVLDAYETKNQELTLATKQVEAHEASITEFKTALEERGVEAGKMREVMDEFQIALAKSITENKKEDYRESIEYKSFESFVIEDADKLSIETKAELRTDSATEGGVLVTSEMESMIVKKITEIDGIRQIARVRPIAAKSLVVPIETAIPVAQYEGEAETSPESIQAYGSETLTAYRLTHTVPITRDMLMDAAFDMNAEIMDSSARAFAFGEGNGFVVGDGLKQPHGFLNDTRITQVSSLSSTGGEITAGDILNIQGELKVGYSGTLVFNRRTLATLRRLRSAAHTVNIEDGGFLWSPALDGPAMSAIGGSPYILANSMPDLTNDSLSVAYGDFSVGYLIIDRTATEVIRDDLTRKKEAIVEFTIHRWNTGKVILPEALKLIKFDA